MSKMASWTKDNSTRQNQQPTQSESRFHRHSTEKQRLIAVEQAKQGKQTQADSNEAPFFSFLEVKVGDFWMYWKSRTAI